MKILSLHELYSTDDVKSKKRLNRLIEISCIDPAVRLCVKVTSLDRLWECDLNTILTMNHQNQFSDNEDHQNGSPSLAVDGIKFTGLENEVADELEIYLTLRQSASEMLLNDEFILTSLYSSLVLKKPDERTKELHPTSASHSEGVYVFCDPRINDNKITSYNYGDVICRKSDLFICIDTLSTKYKEELKEILPETLKIPEYVRTRMQVFPSNYDNPPERLEPLIEAYTSFWANTKLDLLQKKERDSINDEVRQYIESRFIKLEGTFNEFQNVGKKLLEFSVKVVEPDFFKRGVNYIDSDIYSGVPVKLRLLTCVAEYFWKEVDPYNASTHPEGVYIKQVLRLFKKSGEVDLSEKSSKQNDWIKSAREFQAQHDYRAILTRYPEFRYFNNLSFGSDIGFAASIIRPSWAKAKCKAGGSSVYPEMATHEFFQHAFRPQEDDDIEFDNEYDFDYYDKNDWYP